MEINQKDNNKELIKAELKTQVLDNLTVIKRLSGDLSRPDLENIPGATNLIDRLVDVISEQSKINP